MKRLFLSLIDLLLPPTCLLCDHRLGDGASPRVCGRCLAGVPAFPEPALPAHPPLDRLFALGPYEAGLKEAITRLKFQGRPATARILKDLVPAGIFGGERYDALIPVPLTSRRARARGYNQAGLIARELGRLTILPVAADWMERVGDAPPQVGLSEADRKRNVRGAFRINPARIGVVDDRTFLVVDDVTTTGSTLAECARVLKRAGARRVDGFVMARTL